MRFRISHHCPTLTCSGNDSPNRRVSVEPTVTVLRIRPSAARTGSSTGTAKNSLPFEVEGARYFYDNDVTGKEWSVKRIAQDHSVFCWRKFIEENGLSEYQHKIKDFRP